MQLVTKINLAMVTTFAFGLAASGWHAYRLTQNNAQNTVTKKPLYEKKKSLYIAHPIKITNLSCLKCHSTPGLQPIKPSRAL